MRRVDPVLALVGLAVAACGDEPPVTSTEPFDDEQHYTATATVLESPEHGPQLCLGAVATSLPPQCGGPDIDNWSWDDVEAESMSGTTWGYYTVVGTYDGERFTLTEPPSDPAERAPGSAFLEPFRFDTPCEEPPDGWGVVDEATATWDALTAAIEHAETQSDHAGTWLDQSINEALRDADPEEAEAAANDPTQLVLNFRFTGDIERHEREIREIWGGALCVSLAEHTERELRDIQARLHGEAPDLLSVGVDSVQGVVELHVIVDDGRLQQELDDRYGAGLVRVTSALTPVD
jgi:hypothetical protein